MRFTQAARASMRGSNFQEIHSIHYASYTNESHPTYSKVKLAPNFDTVPPFAWADSVCKCDETGGSCRDDSCARYYYYSGCGDNCLNSNCENQGVADRLTSEYSDELGLVVDEYDGKGLGVCTKKFIRANTDIAPYTGLAIRGDTADHLTKTNRHVVELDPETGTCIDGESHGSIARFFNSSCDPNCELIKFTEATGERLVIIRTMRDIQVDEELTVSYGFTKLTHGDKPTVCLCNKPNCVKYIELDGQDASTVVHTSTGMFCSLLQRGMDRNPLLEDNMEPEANARICHPGRFQESASQLHHYLPTRGVLKDTRRCQHCYYKKAKQNAALKKQYQARNLIPPKFKVVDNRHLVGLCKECNVLLCYDCFSDDTEWHVGPAAFTGSGVIVADNSFDEGHELLVVDDTPVLEQVAAVEQADAILEPVVPDAFVAALDLNDSNDSLSDLIVDVLMESVDESDDNDHEPRNDSNFIGGDLCLECDMEILHGYSMDYDSYVLDENDVGDESWELFGNDN